MDASGIFKELIKIIIKSKKRGFQSELAQQCGIDPKHFSDFLNNRSVLSETKRIAIVEELGFEYDEFLYLAKTGAEIGPDGKLRPSKMAKKVQRIYSRKCDQERPPGDMLDGFTSKSVARLCIERLLEIDGHNPDKLKRVANYLYGLLEGVEPDDDQGIKNPVKQTGT